MENTHNFFIPKNNLIGVGSIKDLTNELLNWKLSKVLIVTDKNLISLGWVEQVEKILKNLFIFYDIFDGVTHTNPTVSFVEDGLAYFPSELELRRDYHLLISIGGGSNHDCAKGIAAVATNGGSITDYEGYNKITKPALPHITINTTYSGAAMTMFAIITDESRQVKMTVASPNITPLVSVNDPMLMVTMPPEVTAESGIDALGHAIESFVSTEASPITDTLALGAVRLILRYLKRAYENGNDLEAREQLMFAAVLAGMAYNNAGVGYSHALGHQLGGFYSQFHGEYEGILLPHVLAYNAPSVPEGKLRELAEVMGINAGRKTEALNRICTSLRKLGTEVGIPGNLTKMGVQQKDLDTLAQNALKDISGLTNPRRGTIEDVKNIYLSAM
ncbi:MAG: iron-containing alcohol dehydrogenase [Bacillota bacterium]